METLYIGIDQSISNSGITAINEDNEIIYSSAIPCSNDFMKFYKDNHVCDFKQTQAYKLGLIDDNLKRTKKVKDYTKQEKELLKVSKQKRIFYISKILDNILTYYDSDNYNIVVGFESISFGSSGAIADLGRLLGGLECVVGMKGYKHILFTPTEVKKFAGKGNFDKNQMINAVPEDDLEMLKATCPKDTKGNYKGLDDRCDSYWIAKLLQSTIKG